MQDQSSKSCVMNMAPHEDFTIPPYRTVTVESQLNVTTPHRSSIQQREFGNYGFLDEIARGDMGVVYRAKQVGLNHIAARKTTLNEFH